jgi:stearoyl-CoA desaturase (Delta-9 desaturase)
VVPSTRCHPTRLRSRSAVDDVPRTDPAPRPMAPAHRYANLAAVVLPAAAILGAAAWTWGSGFRVPDLIALVLMYAVSGFGITVGFHRLLAHRSFVAPRWLELTFAVLGTTSAQGPVIMWVADHRKHHAFADADGDTHSPHTEGDGLIRGLWHAHLGWILNRHGQSDWHGYAPDLVEDRAMRRISRGAGAIVLSGLALPFAAGALVYGSLVGAAQMLLWAGLVRIFLFQHFASFAVNSLCHWRGRRPFATNDRSTNLAWLAVPSLGEAWHNDHHAFPRSAAHGLNRFEFDPSRYFIVTLEHVGLALQVVRIPSERQCTVRAMNYGNRRGIEDGLHLSAPAAAAGRRQARPRP